MTKATPDQSWLREGGAQHLKHPTEARLMSEVTQACLTDWPSFPFPGGPGGPITPGSPGGPVGPACPGFPGSP